MPFDVGQSRVIFFDHTDLSDAGRAQTEVQEQIEASLAGIPDNPIAGGMRLTKLQGGNVEERTLAAMMDRLERLAMTTEDINERLRKVHPREQATEAASATQSPFRLVERPPEISKGEFEEILAKRRLDAQDAEGVSPTHDDEVIRLEESDIDPPWEDDVDGRR